MVLKTPLWVLTAIARSNGYRLFYCPNFNTLPKQLIFWRNKIRVVSVEFSNEKMPALSHPIGLKERAIALRSKGWTLEAIADEIAKEFGIKVSVASVWRWAEASRKEVAA